MNALSASGSDSTASATNSSQGVGGQASPISRSSLSLIQKVSARKWWPLLLVPVLLVPVAIVSQRGNESMEVAEAQALPVETVRLQLTQSYSTERTYSGELVARRSSELGFERPGTVVALQVDDGDRVSAGEPLAQLDIRDLEAQRSQLEAQRRQVLAQLQELEAGPRGEDISAAEAAVSDLRNQLELAELQAERRAALFAQGAISAEELDERRFGANAIAERLQQAQSQLDELRNGTRVEQISAQRAQVEQIDARIRAVDISLDKSVLFAPFSGQVSARQVDEGAVVNSGQTVMALVENDVMEARIGVPEAVAQRLDIGSRQTVEVGNNAFSSVVSAKLPEVNETSQTVTVVLEVAPDERLTAGATARLPTTESQRETGYWLPSTALVAGERGLWSVYALEQQDDTYRVVRRDVEVLHTENAADSEQFIEDASGSPGQLSSRSFVRGLVGEGDRIITSGTHRIVVGQSVTPQSTRPDN